MFYFIVQIIIKILSLKCKIYLCKAIHINQAAGGPINQSCQPRVEHVALKYIKTKIEEHTEKLQRPIFST